ncbi:hypothetical protein ILUMI_00169 [Ignelater luminosus]|uniref:Aminopeptidase N n=1 Tax=Ignelater luminosus TaxID=2038154 RepID=A0A8K0DMD5_IGNLU|nr:hypothetical protein ILUMI_00169 [Ignelater luminosus]
MAIKLAILLFLLVSTIHACPPPLEERSDFRSARDTNYRLPRNIQPIRYEITLEPRLESNLNPPPFTGAVNIELVPTEDTYNITLHTRQLNLTEESIEIIHSSGSKIPITDIKRDYVREFHIFQVDAPLVKNELYNLSIPHYVGTLNSQNAGFYLAKYYDKHGRERRFATTQFQSTSARRAYPSFDEPHMKATFIVNLIRPENFFSIANEEPLYTKTLGNGKAMDVYKETVKMSTYLTAFVVSDYKHTNKTENQRVFADEDSVNDGQAEYALDVGIDILKNLEDYLDVKYPLAKMDQIAIPDDYLSFSAMENWGLVTYKCV